jgi:DNA-directed RNA polymerase I subunit RPA2
MGKVHDTFLTDRIELLLRSFRRFTMYTKEQSLAYLGSKFGVMLDSPEDALDIDVGADFLKRVILVHLDDPKDKADLLIVMVQKLYSLVAGECCADNPDSTQQQEVLLPGHLFSSIIKEKFLDYLVAIKTQVRTDIRRQPHTVNFHDKKYMLKVLSKLSGAADIGKKLEYFLATGNLVSNTGLDLQQTSGYTIVAEKLNFYRYVAHFRSIHRGSFFAELKTTTVRKLLPESWGFMCPVHTPDGSPCGLLNHLSHSCQIIISRVDSSGIPKLIASLGASQMAGLGVQISSATPKDASLDEQVLAIQLDGRVIGYSTAKKAKEIADVLRYCKVEGLKNIPLELEIGLVMPSKGGQYPGLYLFTGFARMMRPVQYLATGKEDLVGPFEQVYMEIACLKEDIVPGKTTHQEFTPTNMLSVIANLTPFSDFNQSPRNMYQCQMGKQSMGTPAQNLPYRTDNKMYRLQTGQSPIVRPDLHNEYGVDGYPNGMNAVVCVISYTGYDMEDASIISKSAHERGYGYGTVYKGEWVDLSVHRRRGEPISHYFGFDTPSGQDVKFSKKAMERAMDFLDADGLPMVGVRLSQGDPMYAFIDDVTGVVKVVPYKGMEDAYVDQVRLIGKSLLLECV